ncbi:MAG: MBL fold metallo-hydrolase [Oscillibacter sp.]|nr:MBL fold metallo-hydrolase [Oscillibacter sp.]
MKLTWLGHACFLFEQDGYRIVTDLFTGVEGYPEPRVSVHEVYCSHQHADHSAIERADILPKADSPFTVKAVETFHDEQNGALRGTNTVRIFTADGVRVAHLGDLGHQLSPEQMAAIGLLDAVLVPVGGFYTIDAVGAKQVCDALKPRCILPMHYRHGPYGYPVLAGVEDFLALWPECRRLDGPTLELDASAQGVIVPSYQA